MASVKKKNSRNKCLTMCIVKRRGHVEHYDERKVYASVYAAALNCEYGERKSEKLAREVSRKVTSWVKDKKNIISTHVRDQIIKNIKDKDVRLMYESHLDLS